MNSAVSKSKTYRWTHLILLFLGGSLYPVLNNILFYYDFPYKYGLTLGFTKPYFINAIIYLGMAFLFLPVLLKKLFCSKNEPNQDPNEPHGLLLFKRLAIPSILFLISSSIQSYALVYMPTTVWQLFHGFQVLFTTLFAVTYRHQKLFLVDWLGLFSTVAGICVGGVATMLRGIANSGTSVVSLFMTFILVIISHGIRSFQTIKEEEATHDLKVEPNQVVAVEGLWCFFLSLTILTPITNIVPVSLGVGLYESTVSSFEQLKASSQLCWMLFGLFLSSTVYNYAGVVVTSFSSAIHRNLYEMVRPFLVWICSVVTYYVTKSSDLGEKIDGYSVIELLGFALAIIGTLVYNRFIKLPCFIYNELTDTESDEHSLSHNLIN